MYYLIGTETLPLVVGFSEVRLREMPSLENSSSTPSICLGVHVMPRPSEDKTPKPSPVSHS